ncbi:hypothetical protein EV182_000153 [Spiromyces aspiralis]|uniref:Uncharacterized protein n=1 Tax=Spiromyces aspiralis TaxID=68401 RepID=A0ACC1HXF8_9FUNG|nr:hypothetical protein EV182_000153 [Spiromyces aspiralis]
MSSPSKFADSAEDIRKKYLELLVLTGDVLRPLYSQNFTGQPAQGRPNDIDTAALTAGIIKLEQRSRDELLLAELESLLPPGISLESPEAESIIIQELDKLMGSKRPKLDV